MCYWQRALSAYKWWLLGLCLCLTGCGGGTQIRTDMLRVPSEVASIQTAIDASQPGDTVLVAPGHYYETIVLKPGVIVRSEGTEEEHLNHTAARRTTIDANGELKPVIEGADGAVVDGFTLTGLGKVDHHQPGHPHGVQNRGTSSIIINNIVHHMGSTGIGNHMHKGKVAAPYIANNIVYSNHGLGIGSNHESTATIINNVVYDNEELGIGNKNGSHALVENNKVYNNGLSGIGTKDGAFPVIRENEVYNNGTLGDIDNGGGLVIGNTLVPVVENNKLYGNFTAGIGLGDGVSALVRNNETYANRWVGVALSNTKDVKLVGNKIHHNEKVGIAVRNNPHAELTDNQIYSNQFSAFSPYDSADNNLVLKNNMLRDNNLFFSGGAKPRRSPGHTGHSPKPQTLPQPDFLKQGH